MRLTPQLPEAPREANQGIPGAQLQSPLSLRENCILSPCRPTLQVLWTLKRTHTKKSKPPGEKGREGGEKGGEREISAGVVSKKGPPETENLLFPEFVSCRACEVNGFAMKWIYEGVARSQDARLSDCFVNSISLKFGLIFKNKKNFLKKSSSPPPRVLVEVRGRWSIRFGRVRGRFPSFFSTLSENVKINDRIASSLSVSSSSGWAGRPRYLGPRANGEAVCKRAPCSAGREENSELRGWAGWAAPEVGAARTRGPKLGGPRLPWSPALDGGAGSPVLNAVSLVRENDSVHRCRDEV